MAKKRRGFGRVRQLPTTKKNAQGRWQAFYNDPYGCTSLSRSGKPTPVRHIADRTFDTEDDAVAWLRLERQLISAGEWTPPGERRAARQARPTTLADYAPRWVETRKVRGKPLADRTRDHYLDLLNRFILPTFGDAALSSITPEEIGHWFETVAPNTPTYRAHAYGLLRSILATAADPTKHNGKPLIPFNPAGITGGGSTDRVSRTRPATAAQVAAIVEAMPARHQLLVLLADGCGLRFGELAELRRNDVDVKVGLIHVRRGVVRSTSAGVITKAPKSAAGVRDVPIPPHLMPALSEHLAEHTAAGADGLLFPSRTGGHLAPSAFYGRAAVLSADGSVRNAGWGWYEARRVAGRSDLRFHDLRHGALTEAAKLGATLAELMALAGHSTTQAAQRYQHAASERLAELARRRSEATGWKDDD